MSGQGHMDPYVGSAASFPLSRQNADSRLLQSRAQADRFGPGISLHLPAGQVVRPFPLHRPERVGLVRTKDLAGAAQTVA